MNGIMIIVHLKCAICSKNVYRLPMVASVHIKRHRCPYCGCNNAFYHSVDSSNPLYSVDINGPFNYLDINEWYIE